ncbi:MAG: preprotein translocase subunit SecE [Candidatus Fischerbacteria bacterium RBG_13_37_8]|uniref:Protein translocase subunit SecE n=1 Tax=Candidatus Fischerbacteria bacterium RBG_13_37_8 TaxID=1817863 RepID=A0A1F5V995_9BACT|nr:MAG: preprotein translocase subunit SecE [Candidatus Fischerbacteria bacterium RBG_13_37_8]
MKFIETLQSIAGKIKAFFNEVIIELKKVSWPSFKEVRYTTLIVIIAVFIFGIYLFLIDIMLTRFLQLIYKIFT